MPHPEPSFEEGVADPEELHSARGNKDRSATVLRVQVVNQGLVEEYSFISF